jgi:hypothetical protein
MKYVTRGSSSESDVASSESPRRRRVSLSGRARPPPPGWPSGAGTRDSGRFGLSVSESLASWRSAASAGATVARIAAGHDDSDSSLGLTYMQVCVRPQISSVLRKNARYYAKILCIIYMQNMQARILYAVYAHLFIPHFPGLMTVTRDRRPPGPAPGPRAFKFTARRTQRPGPSLITAIIMSQPDSVTRTETRTPGPGAAAENSESVPVSSHHHDPLTSR